jgi:hypothetical protein
MLVANPITNRIQAIKMHRDGRAGASKAPDFRLRATNGFRPSLSPSAPMAASTSSIGITKSSHITKFRAPSGSR